MTSIRVKKILFLSFSNDPGVCGGEGVSKTLIQGFMKEKGIWKEKCIIIKAEKLKLLNCP